MFFKAILERPIRDRNGKCDKICWVRKLAPCLQLILLASPEMVKREVDHGNRILVQWDRAERHLSLLNPTPYSRARKGTQDSWVPSFLKCTRNPLVKVYPHSPLALIQRLWQPIAVNNSRSRYDEGLCDGSTDFYPLIYKATRPILETDILATSPVFLDFMPLVVNFGIKFS